MSTMSLSPVSVRTSWKQPEIILTMPGHGIKYTPLGISIVFNHEIIAHKLLDHPDIDVNKATCESTALHYACLRNSVSLIEAICAKVILSSSSSY